MEDEDRRKSCVDIKTKLDLAKAKADEKLTALGLDTAEKREIHYKEVVLGKLTYEYVLKNAEMGQCLALIEPSTIKGRGGVAENPCQNVSKELSTLQAQVRAQVSASSSTTEEQKAEIAKILDQGYQQQRKYTALYESNTRLCNGDPKCTTKTAQDIVEKKLTPLLGAAEAAKVATQRADIFLAMLDKDSPGVEGLLCGMLVTATMDKNKCGEPEFVTKTIVDFTKKNAPTQLGAVNSRLYDLQLSQLLLMGSKDEAAILNAFNQAKKDGKISTTTRFTTTEAAVAALAGTITDRNLRPAKVFAVLSKEDQAFVTALNERSSQNVSYEDWKNDSKNKGKDTSRETYDAEVQKAIGLLRVEWENAGNLETNLNKIAKGQLDPIAELERLHPVIKNDVVLTGGWFGSGKPDDGVKPVLREGNDFFSTFVRSTQAWSADRWSVTKFVADNKAKGIFSDLPAEDPLVSELSFYLNHKPKFEAAGYVRANDTDSETALIEKIKNGEIKPIEEYKNIDAGVKISSVFFANPDTFLSQRFRTQVDLDAAALRAADIRYSDATIALSEYKVQLAIDPEKKEAFETWKKTAALDPKKDDVYEYMVHNVAAAYTETDRMSAGYGYVIENKDGFAAFDPKWLERAALSGVNIDTYAQEMALWQEKYKSELASVTGQFGASANYRNRAYTEAIDAKKSILLDQQADIIASSYLENNKTTSTLPIEQQKIQMAALLRDQELQFLMGSGGVDITFEKVLDGTYDAVAASAALSDLKKNSPLVSAALALNKFENGGFLKGQLLKENAHVFAVCSGNEVKENSNCGQEIWDQVRGYTMQAAKPTATLLSIALPGAQLVRAISTGIVSTAGLSIAGNAMGIYMTGTSLQDTTEACTWYQGMDGWACGRSIGMTAFAGWSSLSGLKAVNALARTAAVETGAGVGIVTDAVAKTSRGAKILARIAPADDAVLKLRTFADAEGLSAQAIIASSDDVVRGLIRNVYSPIESTAAHIGRDTLGTLVFTANAADTCGKAGRLTIDCALSISMATVMGARAVTGLASLVPKGSPIISQTTNKAIGRLDLYTNTGQAAVACAAAATGSVPFEQCATTVMMAGLSAGQLALTNSVGKPTTVKEPFIEQAKAIADKVALSNWKAGELLLIGEVPVSETNRAQLLSEANTRLGVTTNAVARETNQLFDLFKQLAKEKGVPITRERQKLIDSLEILKRFVGVDGVAKHEVMGADGLIEPLPAKTIEAARLAVRQRQASYDIERAALTPPDARSILDRLTGRATKEYDQYIKAASELEAIAKTEGTESSKYLVALQATELTKALALEARKTPIERMLSQHIRDLQYGKDGKEGLVDIEAKQTQILIENEVIKDPSQLPKVKETYENTQSNK